MSEPNAEPTPAATPDDHVHVWNPRGELVKIPRAQLDQALTPTAGYSLATPEEIDGVKQAQAPNLSTYDAARAKGHSAVVSGLAAALDPGGAAAAWREGGIEGATGGLGQVGVSEALGALDPKWQAAYKKQLATLKEVYPGTHDAGVIGGNLARDAVMASVGVPTIGGVAEGVASRGLAGVASRGVLGRAAASGLSMATGAGVESAAFGATQELSEEVLGDKQLAAEKILAAGGRQGLLGAAFGFGAGAGGSLLKSAARGAVDFTTGTLAANADKLRAAANEQRLRAIAPSNRFTQEIKSRVPGGTEAAGEVLGRYGVTGRTMEEAIRDGAPDAILPKITAAKQEVGKAIGEIHAESPATVRVGDVMADFDKAIGKVRGSAFHRDTVASLERTKLEMARALGAVDDGFGALDSIRGTPAFEEYVRKNPQFSRAEIRPDVRVPVQQIIEQRQFLDQRVYQEAKALDPNMRVGLLRDFRRDISQREVGAIDEAAHAAGNTDVGQKLKKLSRDYQVLSIAEDAAEKTTANYASNRNVSLSGQLWGAATAASGHGLAAPAVAFGHQYLKERGNAVAAVAFDRLADIAQAYRAMKHTDGLLEGAARSLAGKPGSGARIPTTTTPIARRYADAVRAVAQAKTDPAFVDRVTSRVPPTAPETSAAMTIAASRSLAYLASRVPPSINRPAIGAPDRAPRASVPEMTRFLRAYDAVTNPGQTLQNIAAGRLHNEDVIALRDASPKMFEELQRRTLEHVADAQAHGKPLTSDQRVKLGILLDIAADPGQERGTLTRLQASLAADPQSLQNDPNSSTAGRPAPSRPIDLQNEATGFDRLETR